MWMCLCLCGGMLAAQSEVRQAQAWSKVAAQFLEENVLDSAFSYAKKALALATEQEDRAVMARSYQVIGTVFYHQGAHLQALENQLSAQSLLLELGDEAALAGNFLALGWTYYHTKQPELALDCYEEAQGLYRQAGNVAGEAESLGLIGHIFEKKGQYPEALVYQHRALDMYREIKDTLGMAYILENIGSVYEDQESYDDAFAYFSEALALHEVTGNAAGLIGTYNNIGDVYQKTGRYPQALEYTQRALDLALAQHDKKQVSSALRDLGETHSLAGNHQKAYEYLDEGRKLYQEIYTDDIAGRIALMQTLFETEQMSTQISVLKKEQQLNRLIRTVSLVGLGLILLVGGLIFQTQRLRFQKNKQLYEAQQQLLRADIKNRQLNEANLKQELEGKSKVLTSHALHIIQKNRILDELKQGMELVLKAKKSEQKDQIKALIQRVDYSFHRDQEWQDFRQAFEQVHLSFFDQLQNDFPDLSPADLRLCALIRLNMDSKDIATVLGISTDSLRISRYRLKKKLGLSQGNSLTAWIHQVGNADNPSL